MPLYLKLFSMIQLNHRGKVVRTSLGQKSGDGSYHVWRHLCIYIYIWTDDGNMKSLCFDTTKTCVGFFQIDVIWLSYFKNNYHVSAHTFTYFIIYVFICFYSCIFLKIFTLFLPVEGCSLAIKSSYFNKFYWSENALYFYYV